MQYFFQSTRPVTSGIHSIMHILTLSTKENIKYQIVCISVSNASRTLMMNIHSREWHEPFLKHFGANSSILPKIVSNCEVYGQVKSGPLQGVPIGGSLGDQQAAMLGKSPLFHNLHTYNAEIYVWSKCMMKAIHYYI